MQPKDELRIITQILIPEETYHKKLQEQLDKCDTVKRHSNKVSERNSYDEMMDEKILFQDLLADKLGGILGG